MQRRQLLKAVAGAGLGAVCAPMINHRRYRVFAGSKEEYSARAVELVGRSLVIDMLSPFKLGKTTWFTNPDSFKQADFQRFKDSGINAFHIAVGTGGAEAYLNTLRFIASWDSFLANHDRWLMRVDSASDLDRLKGSGKVGVIMGVQNSEHFHSPADVDYFQSLGQRVSQLTYNTRNLIGNGATERRDEGISDFGAAIIIDLDGYDDMPAEENKRLRAGYKGSYGFREKIDIEGVDHPKRIFDLTEGLIRRKYTDREIELVLGGNFKRVLAQIWSV